MGFRKVGILSFVESILPTLYGAKTSSTMTSSLQIFLMIRFSSLWVCLEKSPTYANLK